jgi:hypothetical protein
MRANTTAKRRRKMAALDNNNEQPVLRRPRDGPFQNHNLREQDLVHKHVSHIPVQLRVYCSAK